LVKRQLFEWAGREGAVHGRHALLRHFLHHCVTSDLLGDAEGIFSFRSNRMKTLGEEIAETNSITSNAVRQRIQRLLAKLRCIARNG
jgi:hypothetical protein